jgi:hypothetical protein
VTTQIDANIPIPTGRRTRYPWAEMAVGDSFLTKDASRNSLQAQATRYGKQLDRRFTVRAVDDGFRVWRTK